MFFLTLFFNLSRSVVFSLLLVGLTATSTAFGETDKHYQFTADDKQFLARFSIENLPPPPPSVSNGVADNLEAASFGKDLFFDARLSSNGSVSCATCHDPSSYFTDGKAVSVGLGLTLRNSPSIPNALYSEWLYWDGRKDSLWSQALSPLEHPDEQGISRLGVVHKIIQHYPKPYAAVFETIPDLERLNDYATPASPTGDKTAVENWATIPKSDQDLINRVFSNVGKALMAYERKLRLTPSRFDDFLKLLSDESTTIDALKAAMSEDEVQGMRLFMGVGNCASCHNGPMFTNSEFHNIGAPEPDQKSVDFGRYGAIALLENDEFTCLSRWSDAEPVECEEMRYLKRQGPELVGAFRTPSLRNIAMTAPYMQSGQFKTLSEVVAHYNKPKPPFYDREQHPTRPHFDILPIGLGEDELNQLVAFLMTLTSPLTNLDGKWWSAAPVK